MFTPPFTPMPMIIGAAYKLARLRLSSRPSAFFAEQEYRDRDHREHEIRNPRGDHCGQQRRTAQRLLDSERGPVGEADDDCQPEAATQAQVARQRIEAERHPERGHYQARQWHCVLQIAIDDVAARVESLAAEIRDVAVEFPQAELLRVEAQQAEIGWSQSKLEARGAHLGHGAALGDLERIQPALNPVVVVPFRARRMLEALESESVVA